jgi:anti-sigma-K factor RskA
MMPASHEPRFEDLLPAYALGALDGDDLRELAAHLAGGCERCSALLAGWRAEVEALAAAVEPVAPMPATRQRLLEAIAVPSGARVAEFRAPASPARVRGSNWGWLAAAAAAAFAIWAGVSRQNLREELVAVARERDASVLRAEQSSAELAATREELTRLARESGVLASPGLQTTVLAGLGSIPQAAGQALVNPDTRTAVFHAFRLPPAPAGRSYQLWFIAGGKPVSAGVFEADSEGHGSLVVENVAPIGEIQAWAVTVEPDGGVAQPTGEMVLKG